MKRIEDLREGSPACRSLRPSDDYSKTLAVDDLTANVILGQQLFYIPDEESASRALGTSNKLAFNHLGVKYPRLL